jgi:N-methylhydantoinase B
VRIERYGLVRDSGGAGRYRGGMAIERSWRLLEGQANLSIRSDRRAHRPYGLYGGQPGAPSTNVLSRPDGDVLLPTMISTTLHAGELVYHHMAGGGGWGDPFERPADEVARDVRDDKVSLEAAREQYGVALNERTLAVDEQATAALRKNAGGRPPARTS